MLTARMWRRPPRGRAVDHARPRNKRGGNRCEGPAPLPRAAVVAAAQVPAGAETGRELEQRLKGRADGGQRAGGGVGRMELLRHRLELLDGKDERLRSGRRWSATRPRHQRLEGPVRVRVVPPRAQLAGRPLGCPRSLLRVDAPLFF